MKTEQENCTVTVRGIQRVEGDEDVVELVTGGRFTCHGGRWLIRYEESDDTGYGGCHTSLRYDPEKGQVILLRTGAVRLPTDGGGGQAPPMHLRYRLRHHHPGGERQPHRGRPGRAGRHAGISLLAGCKHGAGKRKRCLCGGVPAVIRKLAGGKAARRAFRPGRNRRSQTAEAAAGGLPCGPAPGSRANSKSYINQFLYIKENFNYDFPL